MLFSENAVIKLVKRMKERLGKFEVLKIKGADINLRVLEGEEETKYLEQVKGQLISKCLFGVFNSPKKRTKTIRLEVTW